MARYKGQLCLALAAVIWGGAFVAQSLGSDVVPPFTFSAARSLVGAVALVPVFLAFDRFSGKKEERAQSGRTLLLGGLVCGVLLAVAINLQHLGISFVDESADAQKANVGKAGFLTALYIVLVPLFGVFLKRRVGIFVWIGTVVALIGMYLLCVKQGFSIGKGDIYVLLCAPVFALQIMAVDYFAPRVDNIRLSCLQFIVCGLLSLIVALSVETVDVSELVKAWAPILYTGILSAGAAYTLQIIGQRSCKPAVASLIMSTESVFSAIFGFLILNQTLSVREIFGCVLMMAAIVIAQAPERAAK